MACGGQQAQRIIGASGVEQFAGIGGVRGERQEQQTTIASSSRRAQQQPADRKKLVEAEAFL